MKKLLTLMLLNFIALFAFGQKDDNNINLFLQRGQYSPAEKQIDSLLEIRKFRKDAYYQYLAGRVYKGLYESNDPNDIEARIQYIEQSLTHFLNAFDFSTKTGNKIYLNNSSQVLNIAQAFINELIESEKELEATELSAFIYNLTNQMKSFPGEKIAQTGIQYALILEKKEQYQKAIEVYEDLISDKNYVPEVFLNLSYLYQSENNFERVVEVLISGRKLFPESNVLSVELVNYALQSSETEKVMKELESAFEEDSTNFQLATTLATLYDKMEQFESAKKYYLIAIGLEPDYLALQYNYAILLYNQYIELNKFLMTGNSDLSFQDINAQRNRLVRQCRKRLESLAEKDFKKEEIAKILEKLEEL